MHEFYLYKSSYILGSTMNQQSQHHSYQQTPHYYYYPAPPMNVRGGYYVEQPYPPGGFSNRPVVYVYSDEYQRRQEAETGLFALMCATLFCCCLLPPVPHCY